MQTPTTAPAPVQPQSATPTNPDDLGIDRAFLMQMAQVPFFAIGFVLLAWLSHHLWAEFVSPETNLRNLGPVVVVSFGMLLAAVIDGWAFKVPNWLTLSLVLSGWILGLLHSLNIPVDSGVGGLGSALFGTAIGFLMLFPMLAIGGMGQGDVKMQMGFGAWIGAYFGSAYVFEIVAIAFGIGAIVGGVFGLIMMILRRQFGKNASNFREILTDLRVMATLGPGAAAERANSRRPTWVRLPYGVPLCVGFLGYLWYLYLRNHPCMLINLPTVG
jgi:prepilin peptidase CpaA